MTALTLLMPGTPMLFQGQEFGSTAPFMYFADHKPELARAVQQGRTEFVRQFPSLASAEMQARVPVPHDPGTFERCKLDWTERDVHQPWVRLYRDLLALRRSEAAFRAQDAAAIDGAVLGAELLVLRYSTPSPEDERLLLVNLGVEVDTGSFPEPLVAPPGDHEWKLAWSSEHPDYGGSGTPQVASDTGWRIPGHAAVVLSPTRAKR
jgi:maltooligosyltrehalose trehalohydrolase